jgi:outer membrane protein
LKEAKEMKAAALRGLFIIGSAVVFAIAGFTQQSPKIAAVDLQKTFEQSAEGKGVISQLRQKEQVIMGELEKLDKQILSLETKLNTQKLTLTDEAQQKLAFELESARIQKKRTEEDSTKEFQRLQFTLVSRLRTEVYSVIQSYAKEQQISLVFDLSAPAGVVYCEPALDITSEIIRRYDAAKASPK